jgi:hypothetical protein
MGIAVGEFADDVAFAVVPRLVARQQQRAETMIGIERQRHPQRVGRQPI